MTLRHPLVEAPALANIEYGIELAHHVGDGQGQVVLDRGPRRVHRSLMLQENLVGTHSLFFSQIQVLRQLTKRVISPSVSDDHDPRGAGAAVTVDHNQPVDG